MGLTQGKCKALYCCRNRTFYCLPQEELGGIYDVCYGDNVQTQRMSGMPGRLKNSTTQAAWVTDEDRGVALWCRLKELACMFKD